MQNALRILNHSLDSTNLTLKITLVDLHLDSIHMQNNSCSKCSKRFTNSSYLTLHWVTRHTKNANKTIILLNKFCRFAPCENELKNKEARVSICLYFAKEYLTSNLSQLETYERYKQFCDNAVYFEDNAMFDHEGVMSGLFGWLVYIGLIVSAAVYQSYVWDLIGPKRRKSKMA